MMETITSNKYAIGALAVIVVVSAWYMLGGSGAPVEEGLVTESFATPESEADRDLVATLLQLRAVRLEGGIFSDPAFQSLKDFGSEIIPEPVGRPNPFAPLEGQAAAVGGTQTATSTRPSQR